MNVPGRTGVAELGGFQRSDGRGGVAGAEPRSVGGAPATYRVRLVYEVDGCDDPIEALVAVLAAYRREPWLRLVDSGVV